jgi:hypothetical protein
MIIKVANPSSNNYTLIVGRAPIHIPAHRWADNPVEISIRDDLLQALLGSIAKRPVLRVLETAEENELVEPVPDRSEFMSACKAVKVGEDVWELTLPNGDSLTIEADHHKRAKEIAYDTLYDAKE